MHPRLLALFIGLIATFAAAAPAFAQSTPPWTGILNSTRAIDWSLSGIPGGIPNRTTICATIQASTYGNGSSDATAGIQSALNSCPTNQVVLLSAGTFRINTSLSIPSNRSLRGAGASQTILRGYGSGAGMINIGTGDVGSSGVNITSGATKGSTSIVVANASGMAVGNLLHVSELNASYVTQNGYGNCTWCDTWWNGTRARGQMVLITSVSGTTIGITPLYVDYTNTPQVVNTTASAIYAGLQNLQLYATNSGYTSMISMSRSVYSWVKGVNVNFADGDHARALWSFRGEIRDSYFYDGYIHTSGTVDTDVMLANKTSGFRVENNILGRLHAAFILNWGAAGNVFAYNYDFGTYDTNYPNTTVGGALNHGANPQMNLFEGNVGVNSYWGSSTHQTYFRNWGLGNSIICLPYSTRGTPGSCHSSNQLAAAFMAKLSVQLRRKRRRVRAIESDLH